jgi:Ca-activated chloride channel family protein
MRVSVFCLCAALGGVASVLAATQLPLPAAGGQAPAPDAGAGKSSAASHFVENGALVLDGRLGHASLAQDRSGNAETFVLATVTGSDSPRPAARPPVHLAIVVDRSGSMGGQKMRNAMLAASGVAQRMDDGDRVTLVAFDTTAHVALPPTTLDASSRPAVESAIRSLRAGGDTCISCALETATQALDSSPGPRDEVRRILLISDGEATSGVRDVGGLRTLAARARDRGFSVSTIGVDLTFDERVMAAIAQESNGRHWFVPDASALPGVFAEELGALESAVATDAVLAIEPASDVVVEEIFDRSFRREGGRVVVPLGTFDAKQEKTILLRVRVPTDAAGVQDVAKLSLGYRDAAARDERTVDGTLALDVRTDGTAQRTLDPFVSARLERSRTAETLTTANDLFKRGRLEEARGVLTRRQSEIASAAKPAVSAANSLSDGARGAARPVATDFREQESALAEAQSGFAAPPASPAATAAATPAAGPAAGGGASIPAAKSAVKRNQAKATDLSF